MEIIQLQLKNVNSREMINVTLSEAVDEGYEIVLLERCRSDIWINHRRSYKFENVEGNTFAVDTTEILKKDIQYDETVVFDIKLKDCKTGNQKSIKTSLTAQDISKIKTTTFSIYGRAVWDFYKNNSGAVSLKLKLSTDKKVFARFRLNTDVSIEFVIDNFDEKAKYYFARRDKGNINSFDAKIPLTQKSDDIFVLNKKTLVEHIKTDGENWSLIEELNQRFTPLSYGEIDHETVQELSDAYSLEFLTENYKLKCIVNERADESYEKIKIWVIGSCYSRLVFRSFDFYNKDYKRFYNPITTIYHMSIPSIVSDKIPYDENEFIGSHQKDLDHYAKDNFEKNIFERLQEEQPDYVIMDNYGSVTNSLIKTEEGCYIDENFYLKDCEAFRKLDVKNVYNNTSDEFFNIYKDSLEVFKEKFEKVMPLSKIILIRANPSLKKIENGVVSDWQDSQTIKTRRYLWNKFDNYFISLMPDVRIIDLRDDKYISEKSPIQHFQSNHLNRAYYQDAFAKINEIVLLDIIKNK